LRENVKKEATGSLKAPLICIGSQVTSTRSQRYAEMQTI
jgi:hypothetical protein